VIDGAPSSFDPFGSGGEHDDELALAVDGNADTAWTSERYDQRDLGGLKPGVGIVLGLDRPSKIARLELDSPTKGWSVQVFVTSGDGTSLEEWGTPAGTADGIDGSAVVDLHGAQGSRVLVWITDLGDGSVGDRYSAAIAEARLFAT
jgi:putative peptidoglycan lipid II flippase